MAQVKRVGIVTLVALVLMTATYFWGGWGRWAAEKRVARVEAALALSEARRDALAGSLDLYKLNFGAAAGHFESARAAADHARALLKTAGVSSDSSDVASASALLDEARALAARLDQAAGQKAAAAIAALDRAAGEL